MSSIVLAYCEHHNIPARLANNGDDCVVICERSGLPKLDGIGQWFLDFGFKLTREDPVDTFERIEFCQTQPVLTSTGWRMVRNPFTATSKDCVSLLSWATEAEFNTWRDAISVCGSELTTGVPVWESFYRALRHGSRTGGVEAMYETGLGFWARGVTAGTITDEVRHSFWRAFGITPDAQVAIEGAWPTIKYTDPKPLMFTDIAPQSSLQWLKPSNPAKLSAPRTW